MKTIHCSNSYTSGFSSLIVVLLAVTLLSAIMISIYSMTLILTRQSTRFTTSEQAFFIAEGVLFETAQRISNPLGDWAIWPNLLPGDPPIEEQYDFMNTQIFRKIEYLESDDPGIYHYVIEITTSTHGSHRKIVAEYLPQLGGYLNYQEVEP